jgi:hypothetical protein
MEIIDTIATMKDHTWTAMTLHHATIDMKETAMIDTVAAAVAAAVVAAAVVVADMIDMIVMIEWSVVLLLLAMTLILHVLARLINHDCCFFILLKRKKGMNIHIQNVSLFFIIFVDDESNNIKAFKKKKPIFIYKRK